MAAESPSRVRSKQPGRLPSQEIVSKPRSARICARLSRVGARIAERVQLLIGVVADHQRHALVQRGVAGASA